MNCCPTCGSPVKQTRKGTVGSKPRSRTKALLDYCRKYHLSWHVAKAVGLERWDAMTPLARKVVANDIRRSGPQKKRKKKIA